MIIKTIIISFNPRPHTAGDPRKSNLFIRVNCFNPRPHTAGDDFFIPNGGSWICFNPRPHTAGDIGPPTSDVS